MNNVSSRRISEPPAGGARRPALVVVRLDDQHWDAPGTLAPVLGSICGVDDHLTATPAVAA